MIFKHNSNRKNSELTIIFINYIIKFFVFVEYLTHCLMSQTHLLKKHSKPLDKNNFMIKVSGINTINLKF
ncbi:hypothetical protein BpHYR1_034239 [Brachionus plicatilis]|uniref:Uncharacterized protein n=1 Tax=Brachionus plicatilis TaxID=10195 RepID=A0A3M7RWT8_BRAPC|nr:hypothetical protein BpHYR1_034239 [Brachionus plicatilis]